MADNDSGFFVEDGQIGWFNSLGGGGMQDKASEAFEAAADSILMYAQANAPWADRTGDARAGLATEVYTDGESVILDLYHTVDYGLWLEVIQNGRFAIIMPTLEQFAPMVFEDAGGRITSVEGDDF